MDLNKCASIIESILFIWGEPVSLVKLSNIIDVKSDVVMDALKVLDAKYSMPNSGIELIQINHSYQLTTKKDNFPYLEKISTTSKSKGLSSSTFEVLAIIAYKQPVTKGEIENIRGVKSDKAVANLLERELVEEKGTLEKPGRPIIYGTTEIFLKSFGLANLKQLPKIEEFGHLEFKPQEEKDHDTH